MRFKYIKRLWCKWFGHKFEIYHAGCTYLDPVGEMAGYCNRCGRDTHGEYYVKEEKVMSKKYLVVMDGWNEFTVDVLWDVNIPNNPSSEEILEEWIMENYGYKKYEYYCLNDLNDLINYEIGAVKKH